MADILINKITFLRNNPYGTFFASDKIEVYVDDTAIVSSPNIYSFTTTGISVYHNGVLITSGPPITYKADYVSAQDFDVSFCLGTEQVKFRRTGDPGGTIANFPYNTYYTNPNSPECGGAGIGDDVDVCDLIIIGAPIVTDASNETTPDGSIEISAYSRNAIQYKLNEDFVYGQGQGSNVFTGLLYGTYRVYLRDAKNCSANIFVEVGAQLQYDVKYRLEYYDFVGSHSKIEILERGYAGAVTEIKGSDVPVLVIKRNEGSDNKFEPISYSQLDLVFISETDQQFIDLYTQDALKYLVKFYKDTGSGYEVKLITRLVPFIYQEEFKAPPYEVTFSATDSLGSLKDFSFLQRDGLRFYGKMSLIKIIAYCLSFTRLNLNIRCAVNMYANGMNTTASDDPFDQTYVDTEVFYRTGIADVDYVLRSVLEPFGAQLTQWNGVWNIVRVEEMDGAYDYREFDYNGEYVSNSSSNPLLSIDYPSANEVMYEAVPNLELRNGYGPVTAKYTLGLKENILKNGDFSLVSRYNENTGYNTVINMLGWQLVNASYALERKYEVIDENNVAISLQYKGNTYTNLGEAYLVSDGYTVKMGASNTLKNTARVKIENPFNVSVPYVKVRIAAIYGSLYLKANGEWTTDENIITYYISEYNKYVDIEVIANQPDSGTPVDGMVFHVRLFHAHAYHAGYTLYSTLRAVPTASIDEGFKVEYRDNDFMYYYELTEITEAQLEPDIIRPNDYNATTNPVQWVLKNKVPLLSPPANFFVDKIVVKFQTNGSEPLSTVVKSVIAEQNNRIEYEKELIIGSNPSTVNTDGGVYFDYSRLMYGDNTGVNVITTNILSAELIYTGWLRDSNDTPYDTWTRDGQNEADKLHAIWLKMFTSEYNRSWRLLRGSMVSKTRNIGLLNSFQDVNDGNKIYVPISMSIDDRRNRASFELAEMVSLSGGRNRPFTSGFVRAAFGRKFN